MRTKELLVEFPETLNIKNVVVLVNVVAVVNIVVVKVVVVVIVLGFDNSMLRFFHYSEKR